MFSERVVKSSTPNQRHEPLELSFVVENIYDRASDFIAKHEGIRLRAYNDTGSYAICYGNRSKKGETATVKQCKEKLLKRTKQVMKFVKKLYKRELTDNQLIALTSLHYNVKRPYHVIWRANNGHSDKSVANAIKMYNLAGGKALKGLYKRRRAEAKLFYNK